MKFIPNTSLRPIARTGSVLLLSAFLVACGGSSGDEDADGGDFDLGDGDGTDLDNGDGDGTDNDNVGADGETACETAAIALLGTGDIHGNEAGDDTSSLTSAWNDNCNVFRGGAFANSLYTVAVQRVVYCAGFGTDGQTLAQFADGAFGPATEAAVVAYQTDRGLSPADGIVGPATWGALEDEVDQTNRLESGADYDGFGVTSTDPECDGIVMFRHYYNSDSIYTGWDMVNPETQAVEAMSIDAPGGQI